MGDNFITWPIPFIIPEMEGQGYYFPKLPPANPENVGILQADGKLIKKELTYSVKDQFECDLEDYIQKAKEKYQGYKFKLPDEVIDVPLNE